MSKDNSDFFKKKSEWAKNKRLSIKELSRTVHNKDSTDG